MERVSGSPHHITRNRHKGVIGNSKFTLTAVYEVHFVMTMVEMWVLHLTYRKTVNANEHVITQEERSFVKSFFAELYVVGE